MQAQAITAQPGQTIQITTAPDQTTAAAQPMQEMRDPPPPPPEVIMSERFFASLDGVVVGAIFALALMLLARLLQSLMIHLALRKAIVANHPVADELVDRINRPFERAGPPELPGDDRNGMVLIAIGLALAAGGLVIGGDQFIRLALAGSFFPLFVGVALFVRRRMVDRAIQREVDAG